MAEHTSADAVDGTFVPTRRASVSWIVLDGESVLYDDAHEALHLLDPIGTTVWECFDGSTDAATLSEELAAAFGADPAVVSADVLALIRVLGRRGLVEGIEPEPGAIEAVVVQAPTEGGLSDDA